MARNKNEPVARYRSEIRRPTSDDWVPTAADGTVRVALYELSDGQWRVCVWGADDLGMERDFAPDEGPDAQTMYELVSGCSDVTRRMCADLGMTYC